MSNLPKALTEFLSQDHKEWENSVMMMASSTKSTENKLNPKKKETRP
jgi:hypothetical protein